MKQITIHQWKGGKLSEVADTIAEEASFCLRVNGQLYRLLTVSPENIHPLVIGHLHNEGLILTADEAKSYAESRQAPWIYAEVEVPTTLIEHPTSRDNPWSDCETLDHQPSRPGGLALHPGWEISGASLLSLSEVVQHRVEAFKRTGALHYAFLFDRHIILREEAKDIGRHNAVDKVIGKELLAKGCLADRLLYLTGRLSQDVLVKCLRSGIPLAVSKAAPLEGAVRLAREHGLGLVGFLRGQRFNVYSRPDLIV